MHFRDSPESLNVLGIPGNNWFRRYTVTYIRNKYSYSCCGLLGWGYGGLLKLKKKYTIPVTRERFFLLVH